MVSITPNISFQARPRFHNLPDPTGTATLLSQVVMYASTLEAASCAAACAASAGASVASVWLMHSLEALETWGRVPRLPDP